MHLINIIKYQLYLLQLENYELGRYFRLLIKKGFFPRGEQRKHLVWTMKARVLFGLAFITHVVLPAVVFFYFTRGLSVLSIKYYVLCGLLLTTYYLLHFLYFIFYILYSVLLWPLDFMAKQAIIKRAKLKVKGKGSKIKVIGIAGSYGKTTMKEVLRQVLGIKYKVLGAPESVNTPVGISRWILNNLDADTEILIVEMGEHYRGDIKDICNIVRPDISVVTGINESHLERMKNIQTVVSTIFELVSGTKAGGVVVLNADDHRVMKNYKKYIWPDHRVEEYRVENVKYKVFDTEKLGWNVRFPVIARSEATKQSNLEEGLLHPVGARNDAQGQEAFVSLLGEYALGNVDAAVKVGRELGMNDAEIKLGIEKIKPVEHRLQPLKSAGDILVIDDAYNGNPDGVREAIKVLSKFTNRRKVFITPGLVEMGKASAEVHRQIGKELAGVADVVVLIKNSVTTWIEEGMINFVIASPSASEGAAIHSSAEQIASSQSLLAMTKSKVIWFNTAQEAHSSLKDILKPGDVVVFQNDWGDQYI